MDYLATIHALKSKSVKKEEKRRRIKLHCQLKQLRSKPQNHTQLESKTSFVDRRKLAHMAIVTKA